MSENVNLFGPVLIQVMNVDRVRQVDHFPIRYKISPENQIQTEISLFPFTYFLRYLTKESAYQCLLLNSKETHFLENPTSSSGFFIHNYFLINTRLKYKSGK